MLRVTESRKQMEDVTFVLLCEYDIKHQQNR